MICRRLRGKEEALAIQEFEERFKTIDFSIEAEGRIASAFYLVDFVAELNKA